MMLKYLTTLVAALAVTAIGCGPRANIAPLSGKVLYKGKPLEFGSVMLQPVDGGHTSTGLITADGSFVMSIRDLGEGAAVGVNRVRVTCYPAQRPGQDTNTNQELALGRSLIPMRYTSFGSSGLEVDVLAGNNPSFVIELDDN